ncbi:hypothetical protein F5X98DRAFT_354168 [Xylaria grammica]|nr:hypothetical protein F5X98DRAFT_354168 [Xylaria grammica]
MAAIKYVEVNLLCDIALYQRSRHASLEPPGRDLSPIRLKAFPEDDYCGTAAIRSPYVRIDRVDNGPFWRGCGYINRNFESLPDRTKVRAMPPGINKQEHAAASDVHSIALKGGEGSGGVLIVSQAVTGPSDC